MTVEAELHVPAAAAQLVHFRLGEPVDDVLRYGERDSYRIDLCLTPRPPHARACYPDRWGLDRFERIGDVFVVPPGETFHARSDGGRQSSLVCHLRPEPIRTWLEDDLHWTPRRLQASLDVPGANIRNLLLRLAEEVRHPGFAGPVLVELIAGQLAIELRRYFTAIAEGPATGGLAPWRLRLIDDRLREVREAPTLAELAELCGLSVRQLTRAFRTSCGCSVGRSVALSRVQHAKRLLATDRSIKVIAHSLGFSSPSAFAFAFRRATGESPRGYRERASALPADSRVTASMA